MNISPNIDPYAVLGVSRDATFPDIKSAHRKRVLKCHPDKIQDESQRDKAQAEFQAVQESYELLADESQRAKYDRKVRLSELRQELHEKDRAAAAAASPPYPPYSRNAGREYRDGIICEERVPAGAAFDDEHFADDSFDYIVPDSPYANSRKHDDAGRRVRSKFGSDKRQTSTFYPFSKDYPSLKKMAGDTADRSARDKIRTKERRREASDKYQQTTHSYYYDSGSDTAASYSEYTRVKHPSDSPKKTHAEFSFRRSKTEPLHRRDDDDYMYNKNKQYSKVKDDLQFDSASDYIRHSKKTPERQSTSSRSPRSRRAYDPVDPEHSSRRFGRSSRSRESMRASADHVESDSEPEIPPLPRSATFGTRRTQTYSSARPSVNRASTTSYNLGRKYEKSDPLYEMAHEAPPPPTSFRHSKVRSSVERQDTERSSPGNHSDMKSGRMSPSKPHMRYKVVHRDHDGIIVESEPEKVFPMSSSSRRQRAHSPPRQERHSTTTSTRPKLAKAVPVDPSGHFESPRLRTSSKPYLDEYPLRTDHDIPVRSYPIRRGMPAH